MRTISSRAPCLGLVPILFMALSAGLTSETMAADTYPSDAVVARFTIDPALLAAVRNTAELADVLHQELKLEAASPLDYEVVIHLLGNVYQDRGQQPHPEGSGIMVSLENGEPLKDRIKDLRFYTYGDFSESEAWDFFKGRIQEGLLYSMNSSGSFEADENGTVWLTVVEAVGGEVNIEADGKNMVLELTAELNYRDGSKFGRKEPPDGYQQDLQTVQLVLAPSKAPARAEPEVKTVTVEETTVQAGGIMGEYGYEPGGLRIEMKDGQYVMSDVRKSPPVYMSLTSIGEHHFSVDYNGVAAKLKFSMDDDGNAFAMSVEQQGHVIKLPRK